MVQTRRQYRDWIDNGAESSQESCSSCSSRESSNSFGDASQSSMSSHNPGHTSMYSDNDRCKRHRKGDGDPYSETVTTYRRRKPRT